MTASRYGSTMPAITAVTAPALRRSSVPTASPSMAATPSSAAVPTTTCSQVSAVTGGIGLPFSCSKCSPSGIVTATATSPAANVTAASTIALAARTRPRRGLAVNVVLIIPRRYSAVTNMTPIATTAISPANVPARVCLITSMLSVAGAMSPDPDTVNRPAACVNPCADTGSALSMAPWMSWPVHRLAGQVPCRPTWSKAAVARVGPPVEDEPPNDLEVTE